MPYERPDLPDLAKSAENDLVSRLKATGRLRRNVIKVVARVWAGLIHGLYGYIGWLSKQLMPFTATGIFLEKHAGWWGIYRKPAARALGRVIFSGTPQSKIEAGITLKAADGQLYQLMEEGRLNADGQATLLVRALVGGSVYDLPAGTVLTLISPLTGVKSEAVVAEGGITGGAAAEDDVALRARFLERVQFPPQGGTADDYEQWALAVPGVTRAWATGNRFGPGTVGVTFVCDGAEDIIPSALKVAEVREYLLDPVRKPVTADVIVYAPLRRPVDIVIQALSPDAQSVKVAVAAELAALFAREATPGGRVLISHVREAISLSAGEYDHVLVSPVENIKPNSMSLLTLGEVSFV